MTFMVHVMSVSIKNFPKIRNKLCSLSMRSESPQIWKKNTDLKSWFHDKIISFKINAQGCIMRWMTQKWTARKWTIPSAANKFVCNLADKFSLQFCVLLAQYKHRPISIRPAMTDAWREMRKSQKTVISF